MSSAIEAATPSAVRRKWHHHWQNLNECRKCGEVCGPGFWHGRAWWSLYTLDENGEMDRELRGFRLFWHFIDKHNRSIGFSVEHGGGEDESDFQIHIRFPFLFQLFFTWEGYMKPRRISYETEVMYHFDMGEMGCLFWKLFAPAEDCGMNDLRVPKWRNAIIETSDLLLGRAKYTCQDLTAEEWNIRLPEAEYPLTVTEQVSTWKRPRWPFTRVRRSFDVKSEKGVPFPGKGENSWDCGDDALFGMSTDATSHQEAADKFAAQILKYRKDRGWKE